jgi:hypothetical protein
VDRGDLVGLRQIQQVVVAAQVAWPVSEAVAPERSLIEPQVLDLRADGAVEDEDAAFKLRIESREPGLGRKAAVVCDALSIGEARRVVRRASL